MGNGLPHFGTTAQWRTRKVQAAVSNKPTAVLTKERRNASRFQRNQVQRQ
jgi:hypothetical protein